MRYFYQFIAVLSLAFSSSASAFEIFAEPLYWKITEAVDWAFTNNLSTTNQNITYETINFDFKTGYRVGMIYHDIWETQFYYTHLNADARDAVTGNVTSAFLASKLAAPSSSFVYQSGQVDFAIDFNIFDLDLSKTFKPTDTIMLRPIIGLKGGWINQRVNTDFQGTVSVAENIKNDFYGVGPKIGIESKLVTFHMNDYWYSLLAEFSSGYLVGHWDIKDALQAVPPKTINIDIADKKFGAVVVQAMIGAKLDYKNFAMKLSYEISDWFNQCQIFDDATGPHNNDLILQGLGLRLTYGF
jgi:hypothetical protein